MSVGIRRKWRTGGITKKKDRGGGATLAESTEEVGGTGFAFFEPTNASTKSSARVFLRQAVIIISSKRMNSGSSVQIRNVTSSDALRSGELTFKATTIGLTTSGRNSSEVLCVRRNDDFGSVPERRRTVGRETGNGRFLEFRRGEEGGVVAPKEGFCIRGSGEGDHHSIVIAERV
jgi:hypothetical protein